jgi:hypothetical protein
MIDSRGAEGAASCAIDRSDGTIARGSPLVRTISAGRRHALTRRVLDDADG